MKTKMHPFPQNMVADLTMEATAADADVGQAEVLEPVLDLET